MVGKGVGMLPSLSGLVPLDPSRTRRMPHGQVTKEATSTWRKAGAIRSSLARHVDGGHAAITCWLGAARPEPTRRRLGATGSTLIIHVDDQSPWQKGATFKNFSRNLCVVSDHARKLP